MTTILMWIMMIVGGWIGWHSRDKRDDILEWRFTKWAIRMKVKFFSKEGK